MKSYMKKRLKEVKRVFALALSVLMVVSFVNYPSTTIADAETGNSASDAINIDELTTKNISFGYAEGYSDYVVIDSDNKDQFDGKTLTGTTTNGIFITGDGTTVNLTIENLNITKSADISSCISVGYGATLNLTVKGTNTLKSTGWGGAGIEVMGNKSGPRGTLTITSGSTGTLNVTGGGHVGFGSYGGAGIGAMARIAAATEEVLVGDIIIEGGTINAQGGYQAAGIGGTIGESGGNITINGGMVNATGGSYGAGIGGGSNGNVTSITINGGTVTATAGKGAAAIGAGYSGATKADYVLSFGDIDINGGDVTAEGNIGYGTFGNEKLVSSGSGTLNIGENMYVNVTGEVKTGSTVTPTVKEYSMSVTIYDKQFTSDTTANIQIGDALLTNSAEAPLSHIGKLVIPVDFVTNALTGTKTLTLTIDNKNYETSINFEDGKTDYEAVIGDTLYAYKVQLSVYDGRFASDTNAQVKLGSEVVMDSAEAKLAHGGRLDVTAEFPEGSLTGEKNLTLTIDGREYTTSISFTGGTTEYEASIGTPLYPVTLGFYDESISEDLQVSNITVKQDDKTLDANKGEFYAPSRIQFIQTGYATMQVYLPADSSGTTEISVGAAGLNNGESMTKSAKTVSADSTNTIVMLDKNDVTLSADVVSTYSDHVDVKVTTNLEDVTVYYKHSDTEITNSSDITTGGTQETISSGEEKQITISGLQVGSTYYFYFVAKRTGGDNVSDIVKLQVTTDNAEAAVIDANEKVKNYDTIETAIRSSIGPCTIKLLSDADVSIFINFNLNRTLDLNGHTLKSSSGFCYTSTGCVVKDSAGGGAIKSTYAQGLFKLGINQTMNLTIEGGTYDVNDGNNIFFNSGNNNSCSLYIKGGVFNGLVNLGLTNTTIELLGGTFNKGFSNDNNKSSGILASGYVYRYLSGENKGKMTKGNVGNNIAVEVIEAPNLNGSLTLSGDSSEVGQSLTATFTANADEWVDGEVPGNYTYTWYSVGEGETEDAVLKTSTSATYTITNNDIGKEIYCVVTSGDCGGSVTSKKVKGPALSIESATITLDQSSFAYDGTEKKPGVKVELGASELIKDKDYRLLYSNNKDAGTARVRAEGIGKYEGVISGTFTITKTAVTVSGITAQEKVYDGTTAATLDYSNAVFTGKANGDTLTVSATGAFSDASADTNKQVTISGITLSGKDASNYELAASGQQTTAPGTIKPRTATLTWSENTALTYNGEAQGVTAAVSNAVEGDSIALTYANSGTNTNTATEVGSYTATVTALGNDNYTLERTTNKSQNWSISYLTAGDATLSGTNGTNGWYKGTVTLTPPSGYSISTDKSSWQSTLTADTEGTQTVSYYLKNDTNGGITDQKSAEVKIDTVAPTGEIEIKDNSFTTALNNITFGYFFNSTVDVTITGTDATSGVKTIEYQKVADSASYNADGTWTIGNSLSVAPNEKFVVYARITDNAGNQTIINSNGVVVYTDVAETATVAFTKTSTTNVDTGIALNGNTVASITKDGVAVGTDNYTVSNDKLILKASYLDTLAAGTYTLTVSYNPMGETYTSGTSTGEAPKTTVITLTVNKAALTVSTAPTLGGVYGTKVENMTLNATNAKVVNASGTEVNGTWSITDSNKSDMPSVGTSTVYELTFTPGSDAAGSYNSVTTTVVPTVSKKAISVTIGNATRKYNAANPNFTYALADGSSLVGSDTLDTLAIVASTTATASSGVGDYAITGTCGSTNYDVTFTNGTLTITKAAVTVSGITAQEKVYDGTTAATLDYSNAVFTGKANGDTLTVTATGTFSDASAGTSKQVTISGITLSGKDASNYELAASGQQTTASATIKPKTAALSWTENTALTYSGQAQSVTATVSNGIGSDSFALTYANDGANKNTATEVGSYTATVTALGNDNYTLEGTTNKSQSWSISYLTAGDATLSGTNGTNGWYKGTVTLTPPSGYSISTDKSNWQSALTADEEGTQNVSYYLKDDTNGGITDQKSAEVKIDTIAPTGEIEIKDNSFTTALNNITFGYFFNSTVDVTITGVDATSDVKTIEYQKVAGSGTYNANGTWTTGSSFSVQPNEKFVVYARITDNAGNQTIINSNGVVVYTDVAETATVAFTKTSTNDVDAGITLNGNTVASIVESKDGVDTTLAADAYEVSNDKLTLKASYLDTLAAGTYTLTVSYNPLGETYTSGTSTGDAPQATVITLTVSARRSSGGGSAAVTPSTDTGSDNVVNKAEDKKTDTPATTTATITNATTTTTTTPATGDKKATTTTTVTTTVDTATANKIVKKAVENKSKEIIINASSGAASSSTAKDASKVNVNVDKSFVNSIVNDTDAELVVETPLGDKTYTQDELKTLAASTKGSTVVLTVEKSTTDDAANIKKATSGAAKVSAMARSVKMKKSVKVTYKPNTATQKYIDEMKALGYTVKYRFYRSTKKSSGYKAMLTKTSKTYTNLNGKADTRYYYKVQVRVYDANGKLVAKTALKQCKYATRVFG